tara:strand:+ start:5737 stop:6054 length:318 start_codon:yes stop_codon:yes gene_type:complete
MLKEIKYKNYKVKIKNMSIKQAKIENAFGLYLPNKSTIYIQKNLNPKNYIAILLHELAHFLVDKAKSIPKSEETFATLTEEFAKIFYQNPKLINIIRKCIKKNES